MLISSEPCGIVLGTVDANIWDDLCPLALRTLRQLAHDEGPHFLKAAHAQFQDNYVDDVLSSGSNVEEVIELRN